jgi:hypothetical protein
MRMLLFGRSVIMNPEAIIIAIQAVLLDRLALWLASWLVERYQS